MSRRENATPSNSEPLPPWWERFPHVFTGEMHELKRLNKTARRPNLRARVGPWNADAPVSEANPERLIVSGVVRIRAARPGEAERWHSLAVEIGYPPTFPFDPPDVRPRDKALARRRHQTGRSRELCYIDEDRQPWRPGLGIEQALKGAREWLRGEITGEWPNETPAAELIAYFDEMASGVRSVLIPEHARRSPGGERFGTFDLELPADAGRTAVVGALRLGVPRTGPVPYAVTQKIRATNGQLWRAIAPRRRLTSIHGLWFRLDREPEPFHDLNGLLSQLQEAGGITPSTLPRLFQRLVGASDAQRGWIPIALEYPARPSQATDGSSENDGTEWLYLTLEWPLDTQRSITGRARRRAANRNPRLIDVERMKVKGLPSYDVRPESLRRRVGSLYPAEPLEDAHVVIVGVGALGSTVARQLAAAGVRYFTIVDPDILKPGNVVRHELRLPQVGQPKTVAMRQLIREINPYAEVTTIDNGTRGEDRAFEMLILSGKPRPTLIVSLSGVKAVEGQVDALAAAAEPKIDVLHGWVYAHAQLLRAFLYRPGRTACTWCTDLYRLEAEKRGDSPYVLPPTPVDQEAAAPFYEGGCGSPAHPGAGNAHAIAAGIVAEQALSCLEPGRVADHETHWLFAGARVRDVDPAFRLPTLSLHTQGFAPHPDCQLCGLGSLSAELTEEEQAFYDTALAEVLPPRDGPPPTAMHGRGFGGVRPIRNSDNAPAAKSA